MELQLNRNNRTVTQNGHTFYFTAKEFKILTYLYDHPNTLHTPEEIYENVWCEKPFNCRSIIYVHICHIREKIEQNTSKPLLDSIWKQGYRFNTL